MSVQACFVSDGLVIDYTPDTDVAAGAVVVLGTNLIGTTKTALPANKLGALSVTGVHDVVQAAVTFTIGQLVYWDDDGDPVGGTPGTGAAVENSELGPPIGFAVTATLATDTTVRVLLRSRV